MVKQGIWGRVLKLPCSRWHILQDSVGPFPAWLGASPALTAWGAGGQLWGLFWPPITWRWRAVSTASFRAEVPDLF